RGECLGRRNQTTAPFIEKRGHHRKPLSDGFDIDHHHNIWYCESGCEPIYNSINSRFANSRTGPKRHHEHAEAHAEVAGDYVHDLRLATMAVDDHQLTDASAGHALADL